MTWRMHCRRPAAGAKGGKGTVWFPCPLLTPPNPPLRRDSLRSRGETGVRGLGSGRLSAYGTLYRPEFTLRKPPRITVRGQTVQGACTPLRKAPLRSRAYPWSTRRPCGPLAFRRATGGSRVQRRVWGSQEGAREPYGALAPFCPCRWAPTIPSPWARHPPCRRAAAMRTPSEGVKSPPAAHRCIGGRSPLC